MEGLSDMNYGSGGSGLVGHPGFIEIMLPGPKVGLVIGRGGETIKQLQEKSGAKMVVIQEGPSQEHEKPLRITGDAQKVEYAKQLVYELLAEKEMQQFNRGPQRGPERGGANFNNSGDNWFSQGPRYPNGVEVLVPRAAVGVIIGKGGDMIKKIQAETGARVQFQQGLNDGPGDRMCLISGKHQAVEPARQWIQDLIDNVMVKPYSR